MKRMQYVGRSNNIHRSPTSHWLCRILLSAKVVWNIRLKGDIFCLLEDPWIFPRYINAIARRGWVEQLRWRRRRRLTMEHWQFSWRPEQIITKASVAKAGTECGRF